MVHNALLNGYQAIDTANHYYNHAGVKRGIDAARRDGFHGELWLQTKVEGCGNTLDPRGQVLKGSCFQDTLAIFEKDRSALGVPTLDLTLIHAPPCLPHAPWTEGCMGPGDVYPHQADCTNREACEMIQHQWLALESLYKAKKTRAIGVSNFCKACLRCIAEVSTVTPMVNQLYFHAGMGGDDPNGLISYSEGRGMKIQAYRPLAQGRLLREWAVRSIADAHGKSTAQVGLRWVTQLGHSTVSTTENPDHMRANLDVFKFALSASEMQALTKLGAPGGWMDNIVGGLCRLDN